MRNIHRHFTVGEGSTKSWTQRWGDRLDSEVAVLFPSLSFPLCSAYSCNQLQYLGNQDEVQMKKEAKESWHLDDVEDLWEDLVWFDGHQRPSPCSLKVGPLVVWAPLNSKEVWCPPLCSPANHTEVTWGQGPKWVFIHVECMPHWLANTCILKS